MNGRWKGALCYAELGTLIPKSGGEYSKPQSYIPIDNQWFLVINNLLLLLLVYFKEAFDSPRHRFWGPVMAFLFSWVSVILLRTSSMAIVALAFAEYSISPLMATLHVCWPDDHQYALTRLTAALCICK